jgi:YhcH/YjgK/YiaL family protein
VTQPYAEDRDVTFHSGRESATSINLRAGEFAIFFSTDGHAPCLEWGGQTEVKKVVIKVRE